MIELKRLWILTVLLSSSLIIHGQIQIGNDIDGLGAGHNFGQSISISSNGATIAITGYGSSNNDGPRVFKNIDNVWTLHGTDINGDNFGEMGAIAVSLSEDGNTLAVGGWSNLVRVFSYDSSTGIWNQKGSDIANNTGISSFGNSLDLSEDGNIVFIGVPGFGHPPPPEEGITQVFAYNSGNWTQLGDNIEGQVNAGHSGLGVSVSLDGNKMAIANLDSVFVYENQAGVWTQIGNEILEEDSSFLSIGEVALSSDGNVIAIGESEYSDSLIQRGRVRVFMYESGMWNQIGSTILGEIAHYRTGWSVSLSSNGQVLAIGEFGSTSGSTDTGRTRIFEYQGGSWSQIGNEIFGEAGDDHSGQNVRLSSDATTLAISSTYNDGNGSDSGHVRVYDIKHLLSVNDVEQPKINLFPNPVNEQFTIQLNEEEILEKVYIYNSLGSMIMSINNNIINASNLSTGIYYVEIYTDKGKAIEKIVVK